MKKTYYLILFLISFSLFSSNLFAQETKSIKDIVTQYAQSFYSGDVDKLVQSINPDIREITIALTSDGSKEIINSVTYSSIVENTRGKEAIDEPMIVIRHLQSDDNYANIKVSTPDFEKYLQLAYINKEWKILNICSIAEGDLSLDDEKELLITATKKFLNGVIGGEAKNLELAILDEFRLVSLGINNSTGKVFVNRSNKSQVIENSLNKMGVLDEPMRNYKIDVLGMSGKVAVVEAISPARVDYLQMIKTATSWKVLNSMVRTNPNYSFTENSPVYLGKPMPDFTLPIFDGGKFTLLEKKGKKVMLVFLRGWIGTLWCPLCQYQYNELVQLEEKNNWREKYNLEVYFVLPYSEERIEDWFNNFQTASTILTNWKNSRIGSDFNKFVNEFYPMDFQFENGKTKRTFPVLVDENREVSRRFKLYTTFWDGIKAEQNMATIYILDEEGTVQFKYFSQQTQDRPTYKYLMNFIEKM